MKLITFRGAPAFLLDDPPQDSLTLRVETLASSEVSLSGRESRLPVAASLRFSADLALVTEGPAARALAGAMRDYQTQPVLFPFWPFIEYWRDRASLPVTAGWWLVFNPADSSKWSLYAANGSPSYPPGDFDHVLPVLIGRLESRKGAWEGPDIFVYRGEWTEASVPADALVVGGAAFPAGPLPPSGYSVAPRFFDWQVDAGRTDEEFRVTINRDQVGFGRVPFEGVYPQTNTMARGDEFVGSGYLNLQRLLAWFAQHGSGASFWAADNTSITTLTARAVATATTFPCTDTFLMRAGDYLLAGQSGEDPAFARVVSVSSSAFTTQAAFGQPLDPVTTLLSRLRLVRMAKPALTLDWAAEGEVTFNFPVVEVPPEVSFPADETLGTTLGLLPTRVWLYDFTQQTNLGPATSRFTSFEQDLVFSGNTYAARNITHGPIKQGLAMNRDIVQLTTAVFADNPLVPLATLRGESPLMLTIRDAELSSAGVVGNARVLFRGEVLAPKVSGWMITADALPFGSLFDQMLPRGVIGPVCNWRKGPSKTPAGTFLMSPACGLLRADWQFLANILNPGTPGWPFTFTLNNLARVTGPTPTYFAQWFAGGWMEFGSGATYQRHSIVDSSAVSGGQVTVTLTRDPTPFPIVGDLVLLYPMCDGRAVSCKAYNASTNPEGRFNNFPNFGGHPLVPVSNPSLVQQNTTAAGSKK